MKNSWMIGVMLLGALTAQAQWKITPEAGFNVTKYTNSPAKIGYKVGAAVSYDFGESGFALQSGLYYVQRGEGTIRSGHLHGLAKDNEGKEVNVDSYLLKDGSIYSMYSYYNPNSGYYEYVSSEMPVGVILYQTASFYQYKTRKGYFQLPIMARYNWKLNDQLRFHLALGPYVAVGISGKEKSIETTIDLQDEYIGSKNEFENNIYDYGYYRFDWGIAAETGIEINRFSAKFSYDMGLGKENKYGEIGCKYHTASFTIGYSF